MSTNVAENTLSLETIKESLIDIACQVLELDEDDIDEICELPNFAEWGFTSVSIVVFVAEINAKLNLELEVYEIFDNPSLDSLSLHIMG